MFDYPVFKLLAMNDTGAAVGHQGGFLIPQDLREYMPQLSGAPSSTQPTLSQEIEADLYLNGEYRGTVTTRYQFQTWGGERTPESRITGNLGAIRSFATGDDILIIERSLDDPLHYKLSIETRSSSLYSVILSTIGKRRWGLIDSRLRPFENSEVAIAIEEIRGAEASPPVLISDTRAIVVSTVKRKVRDQAFRRRLLEIYREGCAISGREILRPSGASGLDAAHVIPVEAGGTDDPRNGILLSKDVHWAFDSALLLITNRRVVEVPEAVKAIPANEFLRSLHGRALVDPDPSELRVADDALAWHRNKVMEKISAEAS